MADAYEFAAEQHDSQEMQDMAKQISRCAAKLKGSSRNSQLRVLLGLLERLPQDVSAMGSAKVRDALLDSLHDRAILHSKQKDVRMYAAACFAQLLRIYAPERPYDDKQLEVRGMVEGGGGTSAASAVSHLGHSVMLAGMSCFASGSAEH